jgi:benzoate-CoA ligase
MTIPDTFNAADYFIDRHLREGRGTKVAIECGDERVTYAEVAERVSRTGSALRALFDVRMEERVVLLLPDGPAFLYAFFGAIKVGAVPVPVNTLWTSADVEYVLNDTRARVAVVGESLLPVLTAIAPARRPRLRHIVVVGASHATAGQSSFEEVLAEGQPAFDAEPTSKDDAAFWLYSSGSTGHPKGCVHLQHDMLVCAKLYAEDALGMAEHDRCFSVAKLFFAYGLGNGGYCPLAVGATTILWPGAPTAANVYAVIEKHRPTLFFSVPTNYGMLLALHREHEPDFDLSSIRQGVSARGAAARVVRAVPPTLRRGDPRRHRLHRDAAHLPVEPRRPRATGVERPAGLRLRGADRGRRVPARGARRGGQPPDQGRLDLRVLLEPAREDEGHHRGALDSDG